MGQDLRGFLDLVARTTPEDYVVVDEEIDPRFEITALVTALERERRYPVLRFDRVRGAHFPVLVNAMGSRQRFAQALGVPVNAVSAEYARRVRESIPPRRVNEAPVYANYVEGAAVDLARLPILTHYPIDGGPYITAGLVLCRDPEGGVDTFGFHRLQYKAPDRLGISLHSRRRLWEYQRRAEERGQPLEVAVVIGTHPLFSLASLSLLPADRGKLSTAGALLGEPVEVVPCCTVDVEVPAQAEIVIEGEILPGAREDEGPFGEFTGYAAFRSTRNVFRAKAMAWRDGALYQSITGGYSAEHITGLGIQREGDVFNAIAQSVPTVRAVHIPLSGCSIFHGYIAIKKTADGQPRQAIMHALGMDHGLKLVVVVDEDVNVYDEAEVLWALSTRLQADRGVVVIPQGMGVILDPSASERGVSAKLGIDATVPLDGFAERLSLPPDVEERARSLLARLSSRVADSGVAM